MIVLASSVGAQIQTDNHPSFKLDPVAKAALFEKAKALKVGDHYAQVIGQLGKPTSDDRLVSKQGNKLVCRALTYYAVRWEIRTVNELHDEYVEICLDENDRVKLVQFKPASTK